MAFNANDYVKSTSLSAAAKLASLATSGSLSGVTRNALSVSQTLTNNMINTGQSVSVVSDIQSKQVSSITSGADPIYFAIAGLNVDRSNGVDLSVLRRNNNSSSASPESKISANKNKDSYEVTAIL